MTHWRYAVALSLLGALACPVAVPIAHLLASPESWSAWDDPERLLDLSRNTLLLVAGTVGIAVPIGVAAAVLVYRTDLPARRLFRFLLLLTLFVPLPLFASGWQAVLGSSGWLPWSFWNQPTSGRTWTSGWAPWGQGLWSAILIHATAALPWVILLVGQGLRNVEPELEEDCADMHRVARCPVAGDLAALRGGDWCGHGLGGAANGHRNHCDRHDAGADLC